MRSVNKALRRTRAARVSQVYLTAFGKPPTLSAPSFAIAKSHDEQRIVFGYASVSQRSDGKEFADLQGDITGAEELEKGAYAFMHDYAAGGEMHQGEPIGKVVESFVVTSEKLKAMGLLAKEVSNVIPTRWWVGIKVSPEAFAKVKSGQYRMFSVQGKAERFAAVMG